MRSLIAALSLFIASPIIAQDYEARNGKDTVRLMQKPCPEVVLRHINELPERYQAAEALVDGKRFLACWALRASDHMVLIRYEDTDAGLIPLQLFKAVPTI